MENEHYIAAVNPRVHVEETLHVILADNSRNNVDSIAVTNNTVIKELNLRAASVVIDIVEDFGVDLAIGQLDDFETVGDLVTYIEKTLKGDGNV